MHHQLTDAMAARSVIDQALGVLMGQQASPRSGQLVRHGQRDAGPGRRQREFRAALAQAGIPHEWREVPGGHYFRHELFVQDLAGMLGRLRRAG